MFSSTLKWMRGKRTLIVAALIAAAPEIISFMSGLDYEKIGLSQKWSATIALVMGIMRILTSTPVFMPHAGSTTNEGSDTGQ